MAGTAQASQNVPPSTDDTDGFIWSNTESETEPGFDENVVAEQPEKTPETDAEKKTAQQNSSEFSVADVDMDQIQGRPYTRKKG